MPVLRSREIPTSPPPPPKPNGLDISSPSSPPKTLERKPRSTPPVAQPPTPAKTGEPLSPSPPPSTRRRSVRLASDDLASSPKRSRNDAVSAAKPFGKSSSDFIQENGDLDSSIGRVIAEAKELGHENKELGHENKEIKQENGEIGFLSLRSGARVARRVSIGGSDRDSGNVVGDEGMVDVKVEVKEEEGGVIGGEKEEGVSRRKGSRRYDREEKGKAKLSDGDRGVGDGPEEDSSNSVCVDEGLSSPRRFTREEKGKGVASSDDVSIGGDDDVLIGGNADDDGLERSNLELGLDVPDEDLDLDIEAAQGIVMLAEANRRASDLRMEENRVWRLKQIKDQHRSIARRNRHKYAHFNPDDDEGLRRVEENGEVPEGGAEVPPEDTGVNVEDWPGPFSTAMKIIRDREKKSGQVKNSCSGKGGMPLVSWTPKKGKGSERRKRTIPSLQSMCLKILSENVDSIGSLNYVPDVLRHKLCQMLCDSRKMNAHFFSLLLEGSPSEIRVADCSWLEEEEFESSIKACDTSTLTVLQLDLCGHCISDASLLKAVAPKGFPVLTTVSLKGACRISDAGLKALISSAPVLRSMNLSQCSLLTDVGIETIADVLGSIVHELYLDDCDTLDAMGILPSLKRLTRLEVLSLRGIGGVSDKFIGELLASNGQNMKELVLANCVNLTDSSLKVIAETCSQLCVLDLSYVRKLTDVGMAHLANGCRGIQDLRLCRNAFSDDAIAAFLEASGESLKELSLNNVKKVGQNSTLSLARCCKNLESLDLSWCRSLTNKALGLIADSCMTLRLLKIFGCTQITKTFIDGHSNPHLHVVGMKLTPILENIKRPDFQQGPLYYSAVPSF